MATFADIQARMDAPPALVGFVEYLERLNGLKKIRMAAMIFIAMEALDQVYQSTHPNEQAPEFWVALSTDQSPEGAYNRIHLSEGYLEHCLGAPFVPLEGIVISDADLAWWHYDFVGALGLLWALAHEYAHLYRPHRLFNGDNAAMSHEDRLATERDADLWAISVVYLLLRRLVRAAHTDNETLKQLTIYSVFWVFRPFRKSTQHLLEPDHLPMGVRLRDFAGKLAIMNDDPTIPGDQGFKLPTTLPRYQALADCLFRCENAYLLLQPGEQSIHVDLREDARTRASHAIVRRWDNIHHVVDDPKST